MSDVPGNALQRLSAEPGAMPATCEKPPATQFGIAVRFVLEHRRQTAAAVVLLCMTCLWFDRNSGSASATATVGDPGLPDVEAMLSEFDAVSARPLREPAEPIETSGYGSVPLTIPHDGIEQPGSEAEFSQYAASSVADAVYPEDAAAKSSTVGSQQTPTTAGKVRFTGNIQPLK